MDLKGIMLSEWSQRQRTTYYKIPFILHSRKGKPIGTENKLGVVCVWRLGGWLTLKGNKRAFLDDRNVLILDCGGVYMTTFIKTHQSTFKRVLLYIIITQ